MTSAISEAAVSLILKFEVGSESSYLARPVWPGGASGVTVGIGYDLGYASVPNIVRDWGDHVPRSTLMRLQSCAGHKASLAESLAHAMGNLVVPWVAALAVYQSCDLPRYTATVLANFPNASELSPDCLGALVSLVMNRGAAMSDTPGYPNSRLEMREIRDACVARNFSAVPSLMRAMKRLWEGKGLNGLVARREAEAALFEQGLAAAISCGSPPAETDADKLMDAELVSLNQGADN